MCHLCNLGMQFLPLPNLEVGAEITLEGGDSTVKVQLLKEIRQRAHETIMFKVTECDGVRVDLTWNILGTHISKSAPVGSEPHGKFIPGAVGIGRDGAATHLFYLSDPVDPHAPQMGSVQVERITYLWYGRPVTLPQD